MVAIKDTTIETSFHEPKICELTLPRRLAFLTKYLFGTFLQYFCISLVCTMLILSPMARFYITENVWLLFLLLFLFSSTYASLVLFTKPSVVKVSLIIHVHVAAFTIAVIVIYNDLMYVYQALLLTTIYCLSLVLYTSMQAKFDFGFTVILLVYFVCSFCFSTILRTMFGGTPEEQLLMMACATLILFYHFSYILIFSAKLTADDIGSALVSAHTLPVNMFIYSSPIHKPLK